MTTAAVAGKPPTLQVPLLGGWAYCQMLCTNDRAATCKPTPTWAVPLHRDHTSHYSVKQMLILSMTKFDNRLAAQMHACCVAKFCHLFAR